MPSQTAYRENSATATESITAFLIEYSYGLKYRKICHIFTDNAYLMFITISKVMPLLSAGAM